MAEDEAASEEGENALDTEMEEGDAQDMAQEEVPSEPGMFDSLLSMVGLGGGDEAATEELDASAEDMDHTMYPGDKQPNSDVMEEEPGFFDGILSMVGLGQDSENIVVEIIKPDVLGTKVKYD